MGNKFYAVLCSYTETFWEIKIKTLLSRVRFLNVRGIFWRVGMMAVVLNIVQGFVYVKRVLKMWFLCHISLPQIKNLKKNDFSSNWFLSIFMKNNFLANSVRIEFLSNFDENQFLRVFGPSTFFLTMFN